MDYRDVFYKKYISGHARTLYGEQSLDKIRKNFFAWSRHFKGFLPIDKRARILDLGCGSGGFIFWLRSLGFENIEGIDISMEQVKEAERLGISGISYGDAFSFLKEKSGCYDLVIARDFIEHFTKEELLNFIPLVFKSLRDGGVFIVQTVNAESWLGSRLRYADFTHETAFTKNSINQLLRVSGFSSVEAYPMRPVVRGLGSLIRYFIWRIVEIDFHLRLISGTGYFSGIFTQDLLAVGKK